MLQVRIRFGDGRETFECLHQRIGQQFNIDAGKACDNVVTVTLTVFLAVTLLEPITTLYQNLSCQVFSEATILFLHVLNELIDRVFLRQFAFS